MKSVLILCAVLSGVAWGFEGVRTERKARGILSYISHIGMCRRVLWPFWSGIHFANFGLESGIVWGGGELPERMKAFIVSEKEIDICEFEMRLEKCFLRSNLSNYDVISA